MTGPCADTVSIELTKGFSTVLDTVDLPLVSLYSWHTHGNKKKGFYAATCVDRKTIFMHSLFMPIKEDLVVDHINGNSLDNRRENLRLVTRQENCMNQKLYSNSTSGLKGVSFKKSSGRWQAKITHNRKQIHLGYYDTANQAHFAFREAELFYRKGFIRETHDST